MATPLRYSPRVHTLRNLQDMDRIKSAAAEAGRVAIIGVGFIGLEMAEQLHAIGKTVSIVELQPQVLPQLDPEMVRPLGKSMRDKNIELILGDGIREFHTTPDTITATLASGRTLEVDLVILSIGTAIARVFDHAAGIAGYSEARLQAENVPYQTVTVNGPSHASYFPSPRTDTRPARQALPEHFTCISRRACLDLRPGASPANPKPTYTMGRHFECRRRAKESRWATMSKIFPKLAKSITMAAKNGGPDPESNAPLRVAINNAKAQNLSKDNIENAIKRAAGKDAADITEVTYEGKGPHGSLFVVECATDNSNRTVGNLKIIFNKNGGQLVNAGQLDFMFNRKSVIEFPVPEGRDLEELELELIDAGLEELSVDEGIVSVIGEYTAFANLTHAIEALGIVPTKSSLQRLPTQPIELTEEQMEEIETLLDKIEDDDDVQAVFTNLA